MLKKVSWTIEETILQKLEDEAKLRSTATGGYVSQSKLANAHLQRSINIPYEVKIQ